MATPTIYCDYISNSVNYPYLKDQESELVCCTTMPRNMRRAAQLASQQRSRDPQRAIDCTGILSDQSTTSSQLARKHRRPAGNDQQMIISTTNARSTSQQWDRKNEQVINNEHLANTEERATGNEEKIYTVAAINQQRSSTDYQQQDPSERRAAASQRQRSRNTQLASCSLAIINKHLPASRAPNIHQTLTSSYQVPRSSLRRETTISQ